MKQAILITAYKNFNHLIDLIDFFDDDFEIFIHIDKKSILKKTTIDNIKSKKNVVFISSKYAVNWGGLYHLKCYLLLAEQALKNPEFFVILKLSVKASYGINVELQGVQFVLDKLTIILSLPLKSVRLISHSV